MNNDAKSIKPLAGFKLQVELIDGRSGVVDMAPFLQMPGLNALCDPAYFARVQVTCGAATWPEGEDIAPATLLAEMKSLASA